MADHHEAEDVEEAVLVLLARDGHKFSTMPSRLQIKMRRGAG